MEKGEKNPKIEMVKYLELIDQNEIGLIFDTVSKVCEFPGLASTHSICILIFILYWWIRYKSPTKCWYPFLPYSMQFLSCSISLGEGGFNLGTAPTFFVQVWHPGFVDPGLAPVFFSHKWLHQRFIIFSLLYVHSDIGYEIETLSRMFHFFSTHIYLLLLWTNN